MRSASAFLFFAVGLVLFIGAIWVGCGTFLKSNSAYERGVATALADSTIQDVLGAPVEESWFLNGSIEGDGMNSHGAWLVRLRGARASGTLRIAALKTSGDWRVMALALETGGDRYDFVPGRGFQKGLVGAPGTGPPDILGAP